MTSDLHERAKALRSLEEAWHRDVCRAHDTGQITFTEARRLLGLYRGGAPVSRSHAYRLLAEARRTKRYS